MNRWKKINYNIRKMRKIIIDWLEILKNFWKIESRWYGIDGERENLFFRNWGSIGFLEGVLEKF